MDRQVSAKGYRVFWGAVGDDRNILKLIVKRIARLSEYSKNHLIVHLKIRIVNKFWSQNHPN